MRTFLLAAACVVLFATAIVLRPDDGLAINCAAVRSACVSLPATTGKPARRGSRPAPTAAQFNLAGIRWSNAAQATKPSAITVFGPVITGATPWPLFRLLPLPVGRSASICALSAPPLLL